MPNKARFVLIIALLFCAHAASAALFSDEERVRLLAFWNAPGRYTIGARAEAGQAGPWVSRMTPEASTWLYAYNRAVRGAKTGPAALPDLTEAQKTVWENWVKAKRLCDEFSAQTAADAANAQIGIALLPAPATTTPVWPGPIPADLLAAVGNPPPFAVVVAPRRYVVAFENGETIAYTDNINTRSTYFRFAQGVMLLGVALRNMPGTELDSLFAEAGMTPFEQHVVKGVSLLEGGFESINTYDTGFLSVGFIQFATLSGGAGSLGAVLKQEKSEHPQEFERDFHVYGVDVNEAGAIVVVDPATGAELSAAPAVQKIIDDKRLTAVFQKAGGGSRAFRIAQIQVAKRNYYPAELPLTVTVNGVTLEGKISDVIQSEAGMATLFDRKVNTGTIAPLAEVVARVMTQHQLTELAAATAFEREIVQAMKYRTDFLADKNLTQPQ